MQQTHAVFGELAHWALQSWVIKEHVDHGIFIREWLSTQNVSSASFICSNSPTITTVFVATIPQHHSVLMQYKHYSALSHA